MSVKPSKRYRLIERALYPTETPKRSVSKSQTIPIQSTCDVRVRLSFSAPLWCVVIVTHPGHRISLGGGCTNYIRPVCGGAPGQRAFNSAEQTDFKRFNACEGIGNREARYELGPSQTLRC